MNRIKVLSFKPQMLFCAIAAYFCLLAMPLSLQAQNGRQLLIGSGGVFASDNYATIARFDIATHSYTVFDSVAAASVSDLIVDGNAAFLAADSFLVRFDLNTWQRSHIVPLKGIRRLAIYQDKLIVSRGFGASNDFVQAFNKSDLSSAYVIGNVSGECEGLTIWEDTAYVAVTGSFPFTGGKIAMIDLSNQTLIREMDLDTNGIGIGSIYNDGTSVFTINAQNWGSPFGVISEWNIQSASLSHHIINQPLGGGSGIIGDKLYAFIGNSLGTFNVTTDLVDNPSIALGPWAGAVADLDQSGGQYFCTETDYYSYGQLKVIDLSGNILDSVPTGISPEVMAIYENVPTASPSEFVRTDSRIRYWPNPVQNQLHIDAGELKEGLKSYSLYDMSGRKLLESWNPGLEFEVNTTGLEKGTYLLKLQSKSTVKTIKFLK